MSGNGMRPTADNPTDVKSASTPRAGWSSNYRRGEFELCETLQARCDNPRHGGRQVPPRNEPEPKTTLNVVGSDLPEGFVWRDPPPRLRAASRWQSLLAPLIANPDRWAMVERYKSKSGAGSAARQIIAGKVAPGRWEAEGRAVPNGSELYVRYLGPVEE